MSTPAGPSLPPPAPFTHPTGIQFRIRFGDQRAVVTEIGAGLREYSVAGVQLLDGYGEDQTCEDARGQLLVPWPNRVADGRWTDSEGRDHQLDITEPELGHAIHGLVSWQPWRPASSTTSSITLVTTLGSHPGWPFTLWLRQTYHLDAGGLTCSTTATNTGADPCPYAVGAHPYLRTDQDTIDEAVVDVPARTYLVNDARLIPVGTRPVAGTPMDLRGPVRIGAREIDHSYTDLQRSDDGRATATLYRSAGQVHLWCDRSLPYLEVYTAMTWPTWGAAAQASPWNR